MLDIALLLIWFMALLTGGCLLVRAAFNLTTAETLISGMALGILLETTLASILCQWIPVPFGFCLCAGLILLVGLLAAWQDKRALTRSDLRTLWLLIPFFLITGLMYSIARGMGIFDDFAHLPVVSLVATGDVPPHFPLNRFVIYSYHSFLIIFAGQLTRIGDLFVWSAMDLARSISFSLAVFLGGLWTSRLTRNRMAGWLGAVWIALGGGTRWLLLLLPTSMVEAISKQITLIGSGASSGYSLAEALLSEWRIEGVGKLPIPFAFTNGILQPGVLSFQGANGLMLLVILLFLLLTCTRWKNWLAAAIHVVSLSALSLVAEADLLLVLLGWGTLIIIWMVWRKTWRLPARLWIWGGSIIAAVVLSLFEGGATLDIIRGWLGISDPTYQTVGFAFSASPSLVSSHLGVLPLFRWETLLTAVAEIGPILLVIPLMALRLYKAFRRNAWFEAIVLTGYLFTLGAIFFQFEGSTGIRNTSRLYSVLTLAMIYAFALAWNWAKTKSSSVQMLAASLCLVGSLGGAALLTGQMPAIQKPVIAPFMSELDAKISNTYWNDLPEDAMVFDPVPSRSVIVFGRALETGLTWYEFTPEWKLLIENPDPVLIKQAGYDYVYLDEEAWNDASGKYQGLAGQACVKVLESEKMWPGIIRKLLDIHRCQP